MRSSHSTSISRAATPDFQTPGVAKVRPTVQNTEFSKSVLMTKRVVKLKEFDFQVITGHTKRFNTNAAAVFSAASVTPRPHLCGPTLPTI